MRNIKSYSLSTQLKAELNFRSPSSVKSLKNIHIDWHKFPLKKVGIFVLSFVLVIGAYMGIKSLYEIQATKTARAKTKQLETYKQHLAEIKAEVENKGSDAAGYANLSQEYLKNKDIERAEVSAQLAVEKNSVWRDAYLNEGHVFLVANKFNEAKAAFEKALEIDPLCGQAHYLLSLTYQELKDNNAAKSEFAKAKAFGFETQIGG